MRRDELKYLLLVELKANGIREPIHELTFHPHRRWQFDLAWAEEQIAVEIEGGVRGPSRHFTAYGFMGDSVKYTEAAILGWWVVRVNYLMIQNGTAAQLICGVFEARKREAKKQKAIPTVYEIGKVEIAAHNAARKRRSHLPVVRKQWAARKRA